jgi:CubicO group peptidase (beta-lactamase class C family)
MPGYRERSRGLVVAVLAAVSCLLIACTGRSWPEDSPSSTASINTVVPSPSPSASRSPDYVAMKRQLQQRIADGDLSLNAVRAVLVGVDGDTVLSYYRDWRPSEYAHVWSVTKSVMSILVGIAIDEGRLRLDQTLAELLPAHADEMTDEIKSGTLRQLLTMTAGIQGGRPLVDTEVEDPIGAIVGGALVSQPGAAFVYSNDSAHLVGAVLRHAVDRPLLDYAREKLFDPLGIDTRPAWQGWQVEAGLRKPGFGWGTDRKGTNSGCCLLKLTASDMLKIGQLYLDQGRWQGRQLVSSQWVKESTTNQLTKEQQTTSDGPYGYLWRTGDIESHRYFAAVGSYGQWIIVVPDSRLVVVTACDDSGFDSPTEEFVNTFNDVIIKPILQA